MLKKLKLNFNPFRFITLCIMVSILAIGFNYYNNYKYNKLIKDFYNSFNSKNYEEALLLSNKVKSIPFKENLANSELTTYFTDIVSKVCTGLKNNTISDETALNILLKIRDFNILDETIDKLILSIDENSISSNKGFYELALEYYNNKIYDKSYHYFSKVSNNDDTIYKKASEYKTKIQSEYKTSLMKEADELVANKYYTKALDLLYTLDTSIVNLNDSDISKKINFIETAKKEYLENQHLDDTEYTSNMVLETITQDNINTFNIESKTSYLVYVNLASQETQVFQGSSNSWTLIKTLPCSTGIAGEETPKGVYAIQNRGDWFFSEEYNQGGKYWVQFMGDYLFHSLPFDRDQTTIVDDTLGKPASHGCIRLKVEDSKWLYDNIPDDTKLIIN